MKKNIVAFQGELGAYSHIAINEFFDDPEIKTCSTFEETRLREVRRSPLQLL